MKATKTRTGKPCKKGGHVQRYANGYGCIECAKIRGQLPKKKAYDTARNWRLKGAPSPTRARPARCENLGCMSLLPYKKALNNDHDHSTGKFRGWLCSSCNTAIGKLGDTVEGLEAAISYLKKAE
jgi:Recombination endonuclease VII